MRLALQESSEVLARLRHFANELAGGHGTALQPIGECVGTSVGSAFENALVDNVDDSSGVGRTRLLG
jgi:hypothetical protein